MIIKPPKRLKPRAVGVITRDGYVLGEWSGHTIMDTPTDAILYAHSHEAIFRLIQQGRGRARFWRKRYVAYEIDGRKVYAARDLFTGMELDEALCTLRTWRDWIEAHGANVGSITGASRSIWRCSLPSRLLLASSRMKMPTDVLLIGGRQEARSGIYDDAQLWDIRSAYLSTMKDLWVGARYREYTKTGKSTLLDTSTVGFAYATVTIPREMSWGALPIQGERGTMIFPNKGQVIEGHFDLAELRAAAMVGLRIEIGQGWIARGLRLPWRKWAEIIETGYELPGKTPRLIKLMANSLWGTFAVNGRGSWVHYENKKPISVLDAHETRAPCRPLSAHISAHMRARLFLEALYLNDHHAVSVHTDGAIFLPRAYPIKRVGDEIGEWSERQRARNLVLVTPSVYSYEDEDDIRQYIVAGMPPRYREKVFRSLLKQHALDRESRLATAIGGMIPR